MILTQNLSNPDAPFIPNNATTRGIRLVVYYSGPSLSEGVATTPGLGALPKADLPPYYSADHVYTIPQLPNNKWQAVVSRGFAPAQGSANPNQPGLNNAYRSYLRGSFPMKVQINDSKSSAQLLDRTLGSVTPVSGDAGYLLLDGRGTQTQYTDSALQLRVGNATSDPAPIGYNLELIGEQPQPIAPAIGVAKQVDYEFDSADPLALWNLVLPANSTSRVSIQITSDGTRPGSYTQLFANRFQAQVAHSNSQQNMPLSTGGAGTVAQWSLAVNTTSSNFITSEAGQYALAIAYHGPQLTVYDEEDCAKEFCNSKVIPVKYSLQIKILSCAAGEFPTQSGGCQKVECPNNTWVFNSTTFQDAGGMRIWSKSGFNRNGSSGDTINSGIAPMIGPTGGSPTVAVVGGKVSYTTPNTLKLSVDSTVMLVKCPALNAANGTPTAWFDVFAGAMERQVRPPNTAVLAPSPANSGQVLREPWMASDKGDLSNKDFYISAASNTGSSAVGTATLSRIVGDSPEQVTLKFNTSWSLNADGWSSLSGNVTAVANNPAPPQIASLLVDLGDSFGLDATTANGAQPRTFLALRAHQAKVTQQAKLGGASRSLQAVILARGLPIKEINKSCQASCLDLRSVNDSANLVAPDRRWEMPDILTNVDAKTVMMSSAGNLTVYSSDHPSFENATSNFSKEFNFSAGKAKVSIGFEPCGGIGPDVVVINGEAEIKVPNVEAQIGASFMLCVSEDGAGLRSAHMSFESPVGLPLGQTGMFLTGLKGGVDIFPDYTKITVGISIQAAPGGNGGALKITGEVSIDTRGLFELQATGKVLGTVDINGKLWVSWNPLDTGFEVSISYKDWLKGFARAHLWQGQGWQHRYNWLPDDDTMHFTGQIAASIMIKEGQIGELGPIKLPPSNIEVKIEVSFGEFCVNASCTVYEWGIKGRVEVAGYGVGLYYGFDSGFDFILGTDSHLLIDQYGGNQLMAASADQIDVQPAPPQVNGTALVSLTVTSQSEQILVTLGWQAGSPALSLINPDGVEINAANAAQFQAQVVSDASQTLMTVQMPKAGTWQAKIGNLSDAGVEHYKLVFLSNKGAPGTPGNRGSFVNPAAANEPGNNSYKIRWSAPEDTPISTTVSLYYYPTLLSSGVLSGNLQVGAPIVKNLSFKAGEFDWDTTGLLNGTYQIRAEVDDGINSLPIDQISQPLNSCLPDNSGLTNARAYDPNRFAGTEVFTSTGTIVINDVTAPAVPTGVQLYAMDNVIMARWNASPEKDVNAYLISWGPRFLNGFIDANHALVTAAEGPEYRIGAVSNGIEYGVSVTAIDINDNSSTGTTPQFATPGPGGNEIPGTPLTPTLMSATSNSVAIQITPGVGAAPASYRAEVTRLDSKGTQKHYDLANGNPTIPGLETGVSYMIRVSAGNSDGWYSNYSPVLQVLVTNGIDGNNDGMADDWATKFGVSDANADTDGDGVKNVDEFKAGSNPKAQDSDGDDFSDGEELAAGSNPVDSASYGSQHTQPRLQLAEDLLSFEAKKQTGGEAATQSVQWINAGGGQFTPQLSSEASWIKATLINDTVQVGIDHNSMIPGYYSGVLKLAGAPGSDPLMGGAQCIRVNAWVLPADDDTGGRPTQIFLPIVSR
ncbi:MAG: fibronectin type III domain-containing protein [Caldilineaceae bacterium]